VCRGPPIDWTSHAILVGKDMLFRQLGEGKRLRQVQVFRAAREIAGSKGTQESHANYGANAVCTRAISRSSPAKFNKKRHIN